MRFLQRAFVFIIGFWTTAAALSHWAFRVGRPEASPDSLRLRRPVTQEGQLHGQLGSCRPDWRYLDFLNHFEPRGHLEKDAGNFIGRMTRKKH